jgi:hypothetical protein
VSDRKVIAGSDCGEAVVASETNRSAAGRGFI